MDADLTVVWLNSHTEYLAPVQDPWFRAATPSGKWWLPLPISNADRNFSALACTEQFQFCSMSSSDNATQNCSILGGIYANLTNPWYGLADLNDNQKVALRLIHAAISGISLENGFFSLEDNFLLARSAVTTTLSTPLPPGQWQREVHNFVDVMLAAVQQRVVAYASPTDLPFRTANSTSSTRKYIEPIGLPGSERLCGNNIRIRSASHLNFSVVKLVAVVAACSNVVMVNVFCVPGLIFWIARKLQMSGLPRKEWYGGYLFSLHREFLDGKCIGPWVSGEGDITVTVERGLSFSALS